MKYKIGQRITEIKTGRVLRIINIYEGTTFPIQTSSDSHWSEDYLDKYFMISVLDRFKQLIEENKEI